MAGLSSALPRRLPDQIALEQDGFDVLVRQALEKLGHRLTFFAVPGAAGRLPPPSNVAAPSGTAWQIRVFTARVPAIDRRVDRKAASCDV
jgi:hypothetical protein